PPRSFLPYLSPADWLIINVCANQLVRSSGPSTVRLKSFWALIWSSQSIGGGRKGAPAAAVLKVSLVSGARWGPAREATLPPRSWNQRPTSSSRALIWATRLRSERRSRNFGWRRAATFI